jgi:hypothetical protein
MERFRGIGWFLAGVTVALVTYLLPDRSSLTPVEFVSAVGLLVVDAESVKRFETLSYDAFCATSSAGSGSLIQAMVGRLGGSGLRCRNLAGLAA